MNTNTMEKTHFKRLLTAVLALLIAFSAMLAVPQPAEAAALPKVTGVKAVSSTYKSIKITWKKAGKVTGYKIYRAASAKGKYKLVKTVSSTKATSYTDSKGVKTGAKYYYKVRAYKKSGRTTKYGSYSKTVSAKAVPSKVNLTSVKNTDNRQVAVSWKKVSGANGYVIYRSTKSGSGFKAVKTITKGSTTSFTNSGLKDSTTYYYKVRAFRTVKGKKVYGDYSKAVKVRTIAKDSTLDSNGDELPDGVTELPDDFGQDDTEEDDSIGGWDIEDSGGNF